MTTSEDKIVQYLGEARAMELGLVSELQAQIAMSPRGSYRSLLEKHLRETRGHADRLSERLDELDYSRHPLHAIGDLAQTVAGQALAVGKAPLALVRGSSAEEKLLKNAKDSCAAEALEIATYIALERVAGALGDDRTARLAASIREDEERMLDRLRRELPELADAVVRAEVYGDPTYDLGTTGAADAVRETVSRAEDALTPDDDDPPWPGYDDLTVDDVQAGLRDIDDEALLARVRRYERAHKNRTSVLRATERKLAGVSS